MLMRKSWYCSSGFNVEYLVITFYPLLQADNQFSSAIPDTILELHPNCLLECGITSAWFGDESAVFLGPCIEGNILWGMVFILFSLVVSVLSTEFHRANPGGWQ